MKRIRLEVCPQKQADIRKRELSAYGDILPLRPWRVTRDGRPWGSFGIGFRTQAEGIALARILAEQIVDKGGTVTLKIKRPDGRIRDERTYPRSSDPRRSKG